MAYLALYRKHRPQNFDQIVGQKAVVTALRNQVKYGQIGHAYLFCGTRGTGKTSTAKVFARAVNCLHPVDGNPCNECELCLDAESGFNVIEIDAASNNGVDNIRDLREEVQYSPSQGKYKVYIIDEVHMLSTAAFNALLKTLEEPPEHAIFILATTDPQKVIPTIVSRCQRYDFRRITTEEIFGQLKKVCELEGIQAEDAALDYIAGLADGGMRDALSILDQAHAYYIDRPITLADVEEVLGAVDGRIFSQMTGYLAAGDIASLLDGVGRVFDAGRDAIQFVSSWNAYLRNLLVVKVLKNQAKGLVRETEQTTQMLYEQSSIASEDQITTWIEALARLESRLKTSSSRRILIEVELIRLGSGTYGAAADSPVPASRGMAGASVGVSQMRPEPVRMQSGAGALSSGIRQTPPAAAPAGQVKDMPNEASPRQADGAGAKMNPLGQ
ncbi:MAG: DNA polymerase III subunit gamma/tau, partial [Firmicutes bacterium]|nr:DNA polymerase III subunit gamma/tau [Bacillota bacterium]